MTASGIVFLLDVDNTLIDNDRVTQDLRRFLQREVGEERTRRYWQLFEELRTSLGYADYLGALQRYRNEYPHGPHLLELSGYLIDYPFANRLYPESLDLIDYLQGLGTVVILSDGDVVFQPRKIERSGLWSAVDGNVLIYVHKEQELADVSSRFPANHYVLVDDKLKVLAAVKRVWAERVTTVFPRQGHYAHDPALVAEYGEAADVSVERVGDVMRVDVDLLFGGARSGSRRG
jgi:FMN phosphatase YigB (HAD superfamily)